RDHAQSVRFITGHLKDGSAELDWPALASSGQTLVFYMGLHGLPEICRQLVAHGLAPTTPVALVEQGTTARQRVHRGSLADLPARLAGATLHPPTLIIVGGVVALHDALAWFQAERAVASGWETGSRG
ncbi:SAM-dependent methyltransferase, partial [Halomonas sp. BM-2019]|uniref:uroporphyrinogen-III C-methyltransferase n=1 Tax=Halomonas sp. BM-2019 TaxID=2811227 RepID=UPI001B3C3399